MKMCQCEKSSEMKTNILSSLNGTMQKKLEWKFDDFLVVKKRIRKKLIEKSREKIESSGKNGKI